MGRPVGGSSAVGCGVFGILSLLAGVGLVVWLGSSTLSGSTSSNDPDPTARTDVSALTSSLEGLTGGGPPIPGVEPVDAAVTVGADLPAEGTTRINGSDLVPGTIQLTWCLTAPGDRFSAAGCDDATTIEARVDAGGTFTVDAPIHRVITVEGTAYDCAARAAGCSVFGHRPDSVLGRGIAAPVSFAAGLPGVDAVAPPGG